MRHFYSNTTGIAAIEFGIMAPIFLALLLFAADFSLYAMQRSATANAVHEVAIVAFNEKDDINQSALESILQAQLGNGVTVDIECNGTSSCVNSNRPCACVSAGAGTSISFTNNFCGNACPSGGQAGYYVSLSATKSYNSLSPLPVKPPDETVHNVLVRLQ